MVDDRLRQEIFQVAARFRQRRFWWTLAVIWMVAALVALVARQFAGELGDIRIVAMGIGGAGLLSVFAALVWLVVSRYPQAPFIAQRIEQQYPDLRSLLVTAVEMKPELPEAKLGFLQADVIARALRHARSHHWNRVVSKGSMARAFTGAILSCALACGAIVLAVLYPAPPLARRPMTAKTTLIEHAFSFAVEPGNTEVERGGTLLALARVKGPMPLEATLVYQPVGGELVRQSMQASLNDPVFGSRIGQVQQDLTYHVEMGGVVSPEFTATVFEYPRLERADALIHYPAYAATEDRLVQDVRTISAPEGSQVTLTCILNKKVASIVLIEKGETPQAMGHDGGEAPTYRIGLPTDKSRRWKLELTDDKGRKNQQQVEFVLNVLPNKPASIKPLFPARDLEVSPLEELEVSATAWDDYGVKRFGLSYSFALNEPVDVLLGENLPAKEKHERKVTLALESMSAEPDQLLSYYFWSEDVDSQGAIRRTMGDMYFAEVRPFEEIFRQGQQPPGGQQQQQQQQQQQGSQNAQRAQQLAELQKEVINATWKVIRRETSEQRTANYVPDVQLLRDSQASALEQAGKLGEQLQDEQSKAHLGNILTAMGEVEGHLKQAQDSQDAKSLKPALAAEQKAYQALLKLRAREHEVVRQQQSQQQQRQQSRQAQSRSQQQMQQLDISNEENRYEQQRTAQEQQETPEDRENRQVLNRLKELARRQHDLNERLKELQNALEEAKTEEQKEEIRNQLKRLQEEQQEILRDTDELQSRMENEQNQERMAQEREQLQQARENTRRASEALEQGRVSQSAAAGTRAEESFNELKEEFRRRTSNRFNEQVKNLREQARTLDQKEQEIGQKLEEEAAKAAETKSLREDDARDKLVQELTEQKGRLDQLQEQMKQTITDAEETEPLLSEKLYDSVKDLNEKKPDRALQSSSLSLRSGLLEDAKSQERVAAEGIKQLRESVEKAAESVLGDETEALRRARQELDRLANELERDLKNNAPQEAMESQDRQDGQQRGQNGDQQGTDRAAQRQPGEQSQAERDQNLADQLGNASGSQPNRQPNRQERPGEREGEQAANDRNGQRNGQGQQQDQNAREPREGERQPGEQPREGAQERQDGQQQGNERQPGENNREGSQPGQQNQPGRQQGDRQGQGNRPEQPGQQQNDRQQNQGQPSSERSQGQNQPGQNQPSQEQQQGRQGQGQQQGNPQERNQNGEAQQGQNQRGQNQPGQNRPDQNERDGNRQRGDNQRGGNRNADNRGGRFEFNEQGGEWNPAPITGKDFRDWSDRLRDVEEMVDDPQLRAEAARIRERARSMKAEERRHSEKPHYDLWRVDVAEPLLELRNRVNEELVRKTSKRSLTPVDRDPTPPGFSEKTRRYYQELGKGE